MNDQIQHAVGQTIELLVTGKYADLERLTHGTRLTANEMAKAVADYGKQLTLPPQDGFKLMNMVEVKNAQPKRWSVTMPLWTKEEGRSDLTLELTAIKRDNKVSIELDDIHVL